MASTPFVGRLSTAEQPSSTAVVASAPATAPIARLVTAMAALVAPPFQSTGPSTPAGPVQSVLQLFFAARRYFGVALFDTLPTAAPAQNTTTGTIIGTIGATDAEQDNLTYTVTDGPANGTVLLGSDGTYNYTPKAEFAAIGGTDAFTVMVDDNIRSLVQLGDNGLHLSVFSAPGSISVPVTVNVAPSGVAAIDVGDGPLAVAVTPDGTRAYVANSSSNTVSVIATATNRVTDTIAVGGFPVGVAFSPSGDRAYVVNELTNDVSVIDTATSAVVATVGVGNTPAAVAVDPTGSRAYVVNAEGNSVSVIDTATNTVTSTFGSVGDSPQGVAVSADGAHVYVANGGGTVSVLNATTGTRTASIAVGGSPGAAVISPDGARLYVANGSGSVAVIDTTSNTVTANIAVGDDPASLVVSPDGRRVYVADAGQTSVTVIDTATNTTIDTLGPDNVIAGGVAVSPDGLTLYSTSVQTGAVSVVGTEGVAPGPSQSAAVQTVKFVVRNLSDSPVTFQGYVGQPALVGPKPGTIIPVGGSLTYGVVQPSERLDSNTVKADFVKSNTAYTVTLTTGGNVSSIARAGCQTAGNGSCDPGGPIAFPSQVVTVALLNRKGSVIEIPAGRAQNQAAVINALCFKGSQAACGLTLNSQDDQAFGATHQIGTTIRNSTSRDQLKKTRIDDIVSETTSLTVGGKVQLGIKDVIASEISIMYGRSWTRTTTFSEEFDITTPPMFESKIFAKQPVIRVTGDFVVRAYGSTYILRGVYFDTPDPTRGGITDITESPLTAQQP